MFAKVAAWFMQNPLQNFLLIFGGSGLLAGAFKWGAVWADRRRILVRVLSEQYDVKAEPNLLVSLRFEVTNLGEKVTSLERTVLVDALSPKAKGEHFELEIQEADLQLPSHSQRIFVASATVSASFVFCWYKRYKFSALRGSGKILRFRNAEKTAIGIWSYWFGYFKLRILRRV